MNNRKEEDCLTDDDSDGEQPPLVVSEEGMLLNAKIENDDKNAKLLKEKVQGYPFSELEEQTGRIWNNYQYLIDNQTGQNDERESLLNANGRSQPIHLTNLIKSDNLIIIYMFLQAHQNMFAMLQQRITSSTRSLVFTKQIQEEIYQTFCDFSSKLKALSQKISNQISDEQNDSIIHSLQFLSNTFVKLQQDIYQFHYNFKNQTLEPFDLFISQYKANNQNLTSKISCSFKF